MISIVTTCLNYSDFLAETYKYNVSELKKYNYWIVTEKEDKATNEFCKKHNINVYHTDQFRAGGCAFNKSRALNSFFYDNKNNLFTNDWILLCDADVVIAPTIKFFAENQDKNKRCLYSTGRYICYNKNQFEKETTEYESCKHLGFFQMFHKDHITDRLNKHKWFLHSYYNASTYDMEFAKEFDCKIDLKGFDVLHLGPAYTNWDGRRSDTW